ncbi:MAG: hypothetical protein JNG88_02880 [Phycisphaerales bacterium]|nr:hypothetical protein [Phycisphaerales bacterium]
MGKDTPQDIAAATNSFPNGTAEAANIAPPRRRWQRWLIVPVLLIALLFGVPYVIGMFAGKEFSGVGQASFVAQPERVWEKIVEAGGIPIAGRACERVTPLPDEPGGKCWTEELGETQLTVRTVSTEPPRRIVRQMTDSVVPIRMTSEWVIEPEGSGSRVTIRTSGTIEDGTWHVPLFRFIMITMNGANSGPREYLQALKASLGEK